MKKPKHDNKPLIYSVLVLAVVLSIVASWLLGYRYAAQHHDVESITPTQAAQAMREDHFYKDYGNRTLIITGRVAGFDHRNVILKSTDQYGARCLMRNHFTNDDYINLKKDTSFIAEGGRAERQPSGVLFKDCQLL